MPGIWQATVRGRNDGRLETTAAPKNLSPSSSGTVLPVLPSLWRRRMVSDNHHGISSEKRKKIKISYDKEVYAAYLKLSDGQPSGVIEISEGVNLDVTEDGKIVGIEILDATKKVPLQRLFSCQYEPQLIIGED